MKKKLFTILFLLCLSPLYSSFASFLSADSVAYFKIGKTNTMDIYMNFWQSNVLRYDPPFYIIRGNVIYEDYEYGNIVSITYNFMYDYNRQTILAKPILATSYDAAGNILKTMDLTQDKTMRIERNTPEGHAADMYFLKNYRMLFYKNN